MSTGTSQIPKITDSIFKDVSDSMIRPWLKCALDGFPGSGKSHTAILIAIGIYKAWKHQGPIYVFDNEKAAKFLVPMMAKEGIKTRVVEGDQLDVLQAAIKEVERDGGLLLIDSLTKVYDRTVKDYLATSRTVRKQLEIQDRPIINEAWRTNFEDVFINANCHIIFTGRATVEWGNGSEVDEHSGKTKRTFFAKGVKMMGQKDTMYAPDFAIYMERQERLLESGKKKTWREATILKDRANLLDGKTFNNPTYKDFSKMFEFLLTKPPGLAWAVEGNPTDIFGENSDDTSAFFKRRDIALEELDGVLSEALPGQTAKEKKARSACLQAIFDTYSKTKIQGMRPDVIEEALPRVRQWLQELADSENRTGFKESIELLKADTGELLVPKVS